ncbi:MAG TPA: hypothetical protein PLP39_08100 [Flavobacterium lutivivi]|nr:hypothetical protein [Flavobacterium lutivivi]
MKIKFSFFLSLLYITNSFACDCPPIKKKNIVENGLKNYPLVFYGEVIKSDTISETYSFKVIELFKGKINSKHIKGKTNGNCSILPKKGDLCIVYTEINNDGYIDLSICSPSQSFEYGLGFSIPPPPRPNLINDKNILALEIGLNLQEYKNENLKIFIYQLEKLRQYKQNQDTISENEENAFYKKTLITSLTINAIFFSIIIFILIKKKISF